MKPIPKLDLIDVAWPVCLLKFKTAVNTLCACQVIDVLTKDPDVADSIKMIVDRSADTLISQEREGGVYRISIRKG
jgi:TusA-related sulfurtransferase